MSTTGLAGAAKAIWISVGCRVLIGLVSGWLWIILKKVKVPEMVALPVVGFIGSMTNTMTVMGSIFFLFMVFASMSTVLAVFENILACVREMTGWNRPKGCLFCGIGIAITSMTTALGYSLWPFQPFAEGTAWLDLWDFIVSYNLLPLGSMLFVIFCCSKRYGWGWDNFLAEANAGEGLKVRNWMKPIFCYVVPVAIIIIYIMGMISFPWK